MRRRLSVLVRKTKAGAWAIVCPENGPLYFDSWEAALREANICHALHAVEFERPAAS